MAKLQLESNRQLVQRRLNLLYILIGLVFAALGVRLWQLQIIQGAEYARLAERNHIRTMQILAPRGNIFDRNNQPLVENRPSFNILIYRESVKDPEATKAFVVDKLGVTPEEYEERLSHNLKSGFFRPVVVKEDVGIDDVSIVEAHRRDHPEIQLGPEPRRFYRYGGLAAHVLGYVGEVTEQELAKDIFHGARAGDLVGRTGLERVYNSSLRGDEGTREVLVDSLGRELGVLDEVDAVIGGELQLTLDLSLQAVAETLLKGNVGAIVAMDPRNGEVLAMAAAPSFDPNTFSARISEEEWNALINNPDHPLQNRAIQNCYPPGSLFKLVMAEAGLEEGIIRENTRVNCTGAAVFYNRVFHCWSPKGHGVVGLEEAITHSCNIFFYELGKKMGIDTIARHARALGYGERTGIDLPGERSGIVPSSQWKREVYGTQWFAGETISVSIGQGAITATPLQVLRAVSAIAMDGRLVTPHLLLRSERDPGRAQNWIVRQLPLAREDAERIRDGMWGSVNNWGTGHGAAIAGLDICGKTGTVQVVGQEKKREAEVETEGLENHAWFSGFAPKDDPEFAVIVFVEHGGGGGASAAPMAKELFRTYFAQKRKSELVTRLAEGASEQRP